MSEQIELMGINKLEDSLLRTGYLIPHITRKEKIPSWDGFVWLYNNKNHNDKNLTLKLEFQFRLRLKQIKTFLINKLVSNWINQT